MTKKIAWLVPYPIEGSGGISNIFYNMNYLSSKGFECHAYVENPDGKKNDKELRMHIENYFGAISGEIFAGFNVKHKYDLIFATAWYTAKIVRDLNQDCKKAYFVQDFEAYFNPMGEGYLLAENSYTYGLKAVTIGKWLTNKLNSEYNNDSKYFDFCADTSIYYPMPTVRKEKAVCFVYQPDKPRRSSAMGIEALGIVKHRLPDVKIYLFGSELRHHVWFPHEVLPLQTYNQLSELYNKCQVGFCISSSNPSRIPFEMMATGLPVVDIYRENNLYDLPDGGVSLAYQTPESLAEAIIQILVDEDKREEMSKFGVEYMKDKTLEYGYQQFYENVIRILNDDEDTNIEINKLYNKEPITAEYYQNQTDLPQQLIMVPAYKKNIVYKLLRKIKRKMLN
ncbi:glycosyltransferase family 4 protein [Psychrobacillus sp. FSL H8-0510]|uniref:glycosyltransferase family 4 protein n=1 Tax=Psychrobacillus sp. FSL H8-0510 TaxID=2921394 RepID=UPI0030F7D5C0